ncbi:rhodanese-like domain-containing protein [Actinomycetospora sp. TBRC 11914]|uniref:MBL fold metallo-hydrolase n=1 Tax=Actinomycetospora sp. TBRC 11914 TaxID=2729387 RepID=UPI00145EA289|nr:MBL fold metallo-hydrolase [Actinomycetospora sp. TBRC 11914]NMO91485.1 MBL fold metallo-hydrolase [Actinomycetospora sp. TBRC 11914]
MVDVAVLETASLGDRSYVAHDGATAVVVDPQRDLHRLEAVLGEHGLAVGLVVETHVHNDYVSGGLALARRTGARYAVPAGEDVAFERTPVRDGDELAVGALTVRVLATPGHTADHVAYVVRGPDPGEPAAVFTGGSLLFGTVGRTDLVDPGRTEELSRAQYRSARRLADELEETARIFPTHGFGSFCSSAPTSGASESTIAAEREGNLALTVDDEGDFVRRLVEGLTAYPSYYAHIGPQNLAGPEAPDDGPVAPVNAEILRRRLAAGEWVVDLRERRAYAADHVAGAIGIGLEGSFATYLGWVVPWGAPVTLLGESSEQIADARRELVRLGIDHLGGAGVGEPADLVPSSERASFPVASFTDLAGTDDAVVLDVRREDEFAAEAIPSAVNVPLHELAGRLDELPETTLWVHCQSGYRAGVGAGILARAGRDVVLVDDDFDEAVRLGLTAE